MMEKMKQVKRYFLFLLLCFAFGGLQATVKVAGVRCEGLENPVGIDQKNPRFSWRLEADNRGVIQTAYQILVASSEENLTPEKADLWNSGEVKSEQCLYIPYQGKKLQSNGRYYWKVKIWTGKEESAWSMPAHWTAGLFSENDWKAQWIGMDKASPWDSETQFSRLSARYLRKEFACKRPVRRATVHIAGLGLYELYFNGKKIGDQVLAPAPTDYRKSILYNSFDVTDALQEGDNVAGVILGNGRFYTMRQSYKPYKISTFGYPKLRFALVIEYADGTQETIGSNASWKITADGPIRSNNEYDGEEYDARKELTGWNRVGYNDSAWQPAQRVAIPSGQLRAQPNPNMKVMETLKPVSIQKRADGSYILDMGQNMVGWLRIRTRGNTGDTVQLRFAETLQPDGSLYTENLRDARVTDRYILKGASVEEWAPRFVYHGFRYVEVKGWQGEPRLEDFTGEVVYDDMPNTGKLVTSSDVLNRTLRNAYWGIRGNYKGMPVDCPQRNERQPWLGDRAMGSLGESYLFGNGLLYAKWLDDIREAQRADGCIPDVAPAYWNYYSDNMTWPSVFLLVADMVYTQFGDLQPIQKNYDAMKRWLTHMQEEYLWEGIMTKDKYGDWCVPPESLDMIHSRDPKRRTDGKLIATAYYYKVLSLMEKFAGLQGKTEDQAAFRAEADRTKAVFNRHFLHADSSFYGNNTVTANILPLAFDMVPAGQMEGVKENVIRTIIETNKGQISTGVIGAQWLMRELSALGRGDIACALATTQKYPSWGYMAAQGATTIWELWNGNTASPKMNSGNHVMLLGDLLAWCYENLAGICTDRQKVAFRHIRMKPEFHIQELSSVAATYDTPYGTVKSDWKRTADRLTWKVSIPANTTATVWLPTDNKKVIKESGQPISRATGVKYAGKTENATSWEIGSGDYVFTVDLNPGAGKWRQGIVADEFLYEKTSFPECHAATIAETPTGLVAAFFGGTKERNPDCCIWVCRRTAGGWTAPQKAADGVINDTLRKACWNPVLYQIPGGELLLFYKVGTRVSDWKGYLVRSKDGGITWSAPEMLPEGFIGPVKNKPVMVGDHLICPSSMEGNGWKVHFEVTADVGKTWRKVGPIGAEESLPTQLQGEDAYDEEGGGKVVAEKGKYVIQAIQPGMIVHPDGALQVLCRTRNGAVATAWSRDQGETWTPLALTELPNNNSGTDAMGLQDGRALIVYNHVRTPRGAKKGLRTPLNVALSKDGQAWYASLVLEDSPVSQYSYPSVIQGADGMIHIVYTWRRQRIKYVKIDPTKLKMVRIENEQWPE